MVSIFEEENFYFITIEDDTYPQYAIAATICSKYANRTFVRCSKASEYLMFKEDNKQLEAFLKELTSKISNIQYENYLKNENEVYKDVETVELRTYMLECDYERLFILNKYLTPENHCIACLESWSENSLFHACKASDYWLTIAKGVIRYKRLSVAEHKYYLEKLVKSEYNKIDYDIKQVLELLEQNITILKDLKNKRSAK